MVSEKFPSIEDVLPHRGAMLLVDSIESYDETTITLSAKPKQNAWYSNQADEMPAWIGIELMAQAVAAWVGLTSKVHGLPVKRGVLLGTRSYVPAQAAFAVGVPLIIKAAPIYQDESGMGSFHCQIFQYDKCLVNAAINVFEPENFEIFLQQRKKDD
ncbi:MAG: beta-hydroxyacyl-ACP dehydratase [Pseudomonadota bacterium]